MPASRITLLLILALLLAAPLWAKEKSAAPEVFDSSGCRGCHLLNGHGGSFGPTLDKIGPRKSREQLIQLLRNPREANPNARMPGYDHLSPAELELIADFLGRQR